jgi:arylsulfatase A-like enzyme
MKLFLIGFFFHTTWSLCAADLDSNFQPASAKLPPLTSNSGFQNSSETDAAKGDSHLSTRFILETTGKPRTPECESTDTVKPTEGLFRKQLLATAATNVSTETASPRSKPARSKTNILLILADDMGWGDLRSHGNEALSTPCLDQLRSESVELEHFYVSPSCSPTRASLLSGRHHLRLRVLNTSSRLEVMHPSETTLAEALKPAGYTTGCFGKWHNGSNFPSTARGQGFDEFFGFSGGFFPNYFDPTLDRNGEKTPTKGFITDVLSDACMQFIEQNKERPFFCYVPFNACHSPMQAPQDLFEKFCSRGFDPKDSAVYAMVENLDTNIGRILQKLDALELTQDTIVVFTTDNGPNTPRYNGGMRDRKGSVFEGGMRVPFLIRWPGKLQAGKRISEIAQHVDVFPTLLELVGAPSHSHSPLDGLSLAPLLTSDSSHKELPWASRSIFDISGRGGNDGEPIRPFPGTVRTPTHRWVHDGKRSMLFDLRNDPGETTDIAGKNAPLADSLQKAFLDWFTSATADTQGRVQRFPIQLIRGTDLLIPEAGRIGGARLYGKGWDYDWAVFPNSAGTVYWDLQVPASGNYEASVLHTCQATGVRIEVTIAESHAGATTNSLYDPPAISRRDLVPRWEVPDKTFSPLPLGTLKIPAGEHRILLKAGPGIEIQALRLKRLP